MRGIVEGSSEIWRAERQRMTECLSSTGLVTSVFVQYDGLDSLEQPPSIFTSLLTAGSSIERIFGDASGDALEETLSGEHTSLFAANLLVCLT